MGLPKAFSFRIRKLEQKGVTIINCSFMIPKTNPFVDSLQNIFEKDARNGVLQDPFVNMPCHRAGDEGQENFLLLSALAIYRDGFSKHLYAKILPGSKPNEECLAFRILRIL